MKTLVCLLLFSAAVVLHAQTPASPPPSAPTTTEALAVVDALNQSKDHVWSIYLLGMCQLVAALVTLALLFNLRSVAFFFLIFYGTLVLSVPFYIPTAFQKTFGIAIILMASVGLISRLLLIRRPPPTTNTPRSASTSSDSQAGQVG